MPAVPQLTDEIRARTGLNGSYSGPRKRISALHLLIFLLRNSVGAFTFPENVDKARALVLTREICSKATVLDLGHDGKCKEQVESRILMFALWGCGHVSMGAQRTKKYLGTRPASAARTCRPDVDCFELQGVRAPMPAPRESLYYKPFRQHGLLQISRSWFLSRHAQTVLGINICCYTQM